MQRNANRIDKEEERKDAMETELSNAKKIRFATQWNDGQKRNAMGTVKQILWHGTEQKTKTRGGGDKREEEAEQQEGEVR